jgi:predicted ATPase
VGREWEYARLVERLRQAADGPGGAIAVAGEAGVGKTRLAQEPLGYLRQAGLPSVAARCYEELAHMDASMLSALGEATLREMAATPYLTLTDEHLDELDRALSAVAG